MPFKIGSEKSRFKAFSYNYMVSGPLPDFLETPIMLFKF